MEHNTILAFLQSNPALATKLELFPYVTSPIGLLPTDLQSTAKIERIEKPAKQQRGAKEELLTGDCVVCSAANSGYHFGCIACAACSAFFRRTVALRKTYHCRRDPSRKTRCPLDRRHRSNCKACRFSRCLAMGMNPSGVQNLRDPIRARSPTNSFSEEVKCEILEEDEAWSSPNVSNASTSEKEENMIEVLANSYKTAVNRRRMFYCNGTLREMLDGDGLTMRPTRFDERYYKDKMRFELVLYLEMMNTMSIFKELDVSVKEVLVKNCAVGLALLEKYHISVKNGGLQSDRIIAPDGSYTDLSDHGAQFDNEIFSQLVMDKETCLTLLYDPLREVLRELGGAIKHAKMTDVEYCALFAIWLFNSAAENLPEASKFVIQNGRNRILKDWFDYYEKQGIEPIESGLLVGNTLLLLTAVRNALHVHRQNFHVIRVFNVMEYDKLIDDLTFA